MLYFWVLAFIVSCGHIMGCAVVRALRMCGLIVCACLGVVCCFCDQGLFLIVSVMVAFFEVRGTHVAVW